MEIGAGLASGKQLGIYSDSGAGMPSSFNPATYGIATPAIPLMGIF